MIEQTLVVKSSLTASFVFHGDASLKWNCRIVDSNLGTDGDPRINFIRNGLVDMTFLPRHLNAKHNVIFYEDHEQAASERSETLKSVSTGIPTFMLAWLSRVFGYSQRLAKWMFWGVVGLVIATSILTALSYKYNMGSIFDFWEEWNAARLAKSTKTVIDETIEKMNDSFYSLPGVVEIEKREKVDFSDLFMAVEDGVYMMTDVVNIDNEPLPMTYDELEDKCESLGGKIPAMAELEYYIPDKLINIAWPNMWRDYPEWARDGKGTFSDDYAVFLKSGDIKDQGGYLKNEIWWADADDALLSGRCIVLKRDFED